MSHIADVKLKVTDLSALRAAVEEAGGIWAEGQQTYNWYGRRVGSDRTTTRPASEDGRCAHAIKLPGVHYEIGVARNGDGTYDLVYDSWGYAGSGHDGYKLEEKFGAGLVGLKQGYGVEVSRRELSRRGYRVTTVRQEDGSVQVRAMGRL